MKFTYIFKYMMKFFKVHIEIVQLHVELFSLHGGIFLNTQKNNLIHVVHFFKHMMIISSEWYEYFSLDIMTIS